MQRYEKKWIYQAPRRFFLYFCSVNMENIIQQTVDTLLAGGTVLYPTDTIWGVGCDARQADAVEKLYALKERDRSKSMLVLWNSVGTQRAASAIDEMLTDAARCVPTEERPTTYILPESIWRPLLGDGIAANLPAEDGTLGIRVPRHAFCQEIIRRLGAPLVSTSANLSGRPSPIIYNDIEEELKRRVDYCVPPLEEFLSGERRGSRIVKVEADGTEFVIRP